MRLLSQGDLVIKEAASACGFADQAYLTRVFRCRLGSTPAQLRRGSPDAKEDLARDTRPEESSSAEGPQVKNPATTFSGRCIHSRQITATAAGSGRPSLMQPMQIYRHPTSMVMRMVPASAAAFPARLGDWFGG
jgi:hypothetical protein